MHWKGLHLGPLASKAWRAFVAGFFGGAIMLMTSIFDQLSKGGNLGGNCPKALLVGVIFGGLTAACRAIYAVLPLDNEDKDVGVVKTSAGETPTEKATHAATDAAQAATNVTNATAEAVDAAKEAAAQATRAADEVQALVAGFSLGSVTALAVRTKPNGKDTADAT